MDYSCWVFQHPKECDMAKDYAKRSFTARKPKKKRIRLEFLALFLLALVCAGGYWSYFHKHEISNIENNWVTRVRMMFSHHAVAKTVQTAKAAPVAQPDVHFDFYNALPHMQVTIAETAAVTPPAPKIHDPKAAPVTKPTLVYLIQLGVFNDATGASQLRLSLMLSGVEAEIIRLNSTHGQVYRVQRGPFISFAEAKKMQHELEMKGITCVLKKA